MDQRIRPWADLGAVALLIWTGIHTLRTYLAVTGWVLGARLPPLQLGLLLAIPWLMGLLGRPVARLVGGRSPALRLAALFGLVYLLYRALPGPYTGPILGGLSLTAWLWLLPALLQSLYRRGASDQLVPGILVGLAGQIGLQTLLHGLDLVHLQGLGPALIALGLALALALAVRYGSAGAGGTGPSESPGSPGPGLIVWGAYLALQLTLLSNLGRLQWQSGWGLQGVSALSSAGLALGALLLRWPIPPRGRALAGLSAALLLLRPQWLTGAGLWLILPIQALLPLALLPALQPWPNKVQRGAEPPSAPTSPWMALPSATPSYRHGRYDSVKHSLRYVQHGPRRQPERTYLWTGAGSLLSIGLMLLYYGGNEWKPAWSLMAGVAALPALLAPFLRPTGHLPLPPARPAQRAALAVAALGLLAIPLSLLPRSGERPKSSPAPADLTVMTYNIHHLFSWNGVPSPEAIARVIEQADPDLVGLQETGRGWNLTGGADLVAWLQWRFPGYYLLYGETEADLVGNILMSRYPLRAAGHERYAMQSARLQRGFVWARIPSVKGDLLFLNTHLSAWRNEEGDRLAQVDQLLRFLGDEPRSILAGDLNARPDSQPLRRLTEGGQVDLAADLGQGYTPTFPAGSPRVRLDYILTSPPVKPVQVLLLPTNASDHRPVAARVTIQD